MDSSKVLRVSKGIGQLMDAQGATYLTGSYGLLKPDDTPENFSVRQKYKHGGKIITVTLTQEDA